MSVQDPSETSQDLVLVPRVSEVNPLSDDMGSEVIEAKPAKSTLEIPEDLSSNRKVAEYLGKLMPALGRTDPAAVLVPWLCDVCESEHSRKAYLTDIAQFVGGMASQGIHALQATDSHVKLYKEALRQSGQKKRTINRVLSVIRGMYLQLAINGLIEWDVASDIKAVKSPRVQKDDNSTPALTPEEAGALLRSPDRTTPIGKRDYAMLFAYFKTTCRSSALAYATVGSLERHGADWYIRVTEKGDNTAVKALQDAATPILEWLEAAGLSLEQDKDHPLFPPFGKDRRTIVDRHLSTRQVLNVVKKHAKRAGIQVERSVGRDVGTHSLRKSALTIALRRGAKLEKVQALAGHADVRTTQIYYEKKQGDADDAAKYIVFDDVQESDR